MTKNDLLRTVIKRVYEEWDDDSKPVDAQED